MEDELFEEYMSREDELRDRQRFEELTEEARRYYEQMKAGKNQWEDGTVPCTCEGEHAIDCPNFKPIPLDKLFPNDEK